jgi:hypothetical protein
MITVEYNDGVREEFKTKKEAEADIVDMVVNCGYPLINRINVYEGDINDAESYDIEWSAKLVKRD